MNQPSSSVFALAFSVCAFCCFTSEAQLIGPTINIGNGVLMPLINLGHPDNATLNETASLELWLSSAVNGSGVDTALDYLNQQQVGKAIRASKRSRDSIFLLTKIPNIFSAEDTLKYIKEDVSQLGMTPDLILIHSPCYKGFPHGGCKHASSEDIKNAWEGMESALQQGLTRSIGVSNFLAGDIRPILDIGGNISVNQCEMYVGNHDDTTRQFCQTNGIVYESYAPLGRGEVDVHDPRIQNIAEAHPGKSGYQVVLRWIIQLGCPMAISATKLSHDLSDLDIFNFKLTENEMAILSAM